MQTDCDMDVLIGTIQKAAMRRGLFCAYTPLYEAWTVINPATGGQIVGMRGQIVGMHAQLEKIFDILDEHPITVEGKLLAHEMDKEECST